MSSRLTGAVTGKGELMDDLISRQVAIDALADMMPHSYTPDGSHPADEGIFMAQEIFADCIQTLELLPSAQPETKQGEWIPHSEMYTFPGTELTSSGGVICSSCGFRTHNRMHKLIGCPYNYCPICGTAMRKKNKNG